MKRSFHIYSKSVWPSPGWMLISLTPYLLLELGQRFLAHRFNVPGFEIPEMRNTRTAAISVAPLCYAAYRLVRFHPICNIQYETWLKTSPWTAAKPLPLGPVLPVWQDAVVVGILAAFARLQAHINPMTPVIAFGLTYLIGMTILLAWTRTWSSCWILGFVWPALFLWEDNKWADIGIAAALMVVIWHGHRKSLRAFPWRKEDANSRHLSVTGSSTSILQTEIQIQQARNDRVNSSVGWPFSCLSPKFTTVSISTSNALLVSSLLGWWTYCILQGFGATPMPEVILLFLIFAALIRVGTYCVGVNPPVNIRGRIFGQPIVPGFDCIFLTPLAAVGLAIAGGIAIEHSGLYYHAACSGVVVAVVCFVLLYGGPSLRKWSLTGDLRYEFSLLRQKKQHPLTRI